MSISFYRSWVKRPIDFLGAMVLLLVLSPILLVLVLLLTMFVGNPFFRQQRAGRNGKLFHVIKFRTMNNRTDEEGQLLPDAQRLTGFGKWVRKMSLDELPQLVNILAGDMSFIGPRPLLPEYLPLYSRVQLRRHEATPGISGWAQVNGRNNISWKEKFELDVWYVEHGTWKVDLKILVVTLVKVLKSEGITLEGQATTVKFNGSN